MEHRLMTEKEKAAITVQACALINEGKKAEGIALLMTTPMPPFLAKIDKEKLGADYVKNCGWNLAEAEAAFGKDWLAR